MDPVFPHLPCAPAFKIHAEERLMLAELPEGCPRYRQRVPQLAPGLRLIGGRNVASNQASLQRGGPPAAWALAIFLIGAEPWRVDAGSRFGEADRRRLPGGPT